MNVKFTKGVIYFRLFNKNVVSADIRNFGSVDNPGFSIYSGVPFPESDFAVVYINRASFGCPTRLVVSSYG